MRTIGELLDAVKARHEIGSDYKLAMFLGIGLGNVRNYRKGRSLPDPTMCARVAEALGEDPLYLIAEIESQRAANDDAADLWRRMAERLKGAALLVLVVLVAGFSMPDANAGNTISAYYVKWLALVAAVALVRLGWRWLRLAHSRPAAA